MKVFYWIITVSTTLFIQAHLSAQTSNTKRVIVSFKSGTTTQYMDSLRQSIGGGSNELGTLNILNTHLWGLPDTANMLDVIGTITGGGRTNVVSADQNNISALSADDCMSTGFAAPPTASVGIFDSVPLRNSPINSIYYNGLLTPSCYPGYQNTLIAIIDAGIDPIHANSSLFRRHLYTFPNNNGCNMPSSLYGYDFASNKPYPTDSIGHGTFVASEIIQLLESWGDYATKVMILKVIGANGKGSTWNVMRAIERSACSGAKIVNLSIAGIGAAQPDSLNALKSFMQYCADNYKMIFIVGAGNSGTDFGATSQTQIFPASYNLPNMICVAADSSIANLASFSNYDTQGGAVHLAAPAINIYGATLNGKFTTATGTSFAAPIVTAIAAFYATRRTTSNCDGMDVRIAVKKAMLSIDNNRPAYSKTAWHGLAWLNCRVPTTAYLMSAPNSSNAISITSEKTDFAITPSPFHNTLNLDFESDTEGGAQLTMADITGRTLFLQQLNCQKGKNTFSWSPSVHLAQGLYIVSLRIGDKQLYQKVMKE